MTYEEARNMIDEMRAEIKAKHMCRSMDGECTSEEVAEYRCRFAALSMAVEALEKQIPKKFIVVTTDYNEFVDEVCPICNAGEQGADWSSGDDGRGIKANTTYCWHCGQALDWSE